MLILRLAWRSFRRHRRRSAIAGTAVALSLAMMLVFLGIGNFSHHKMGEIGIRQGMGHLLIQGRGHQEKQTLDQLVDDPQAVMRRARALVGAQHVVQRVRAAGLLVAAELSAPVAVVGVDPQPEQRASDIPAAKRRVAGRYLQATEPNRVGQVPADIYIGQELARTLNVAVGDRVVLTVSPAGGGRPRSAAFAVCGIYRTGVVELDGFYAEVPIAEAQELFRLGRKVTQVAVLMDSPDKVDSAARALRATLPQSVEVLSWREALKELQEVLAIDRGSLYIMMFIIFIIVTLGIFNTVLMSVLERTREFGVMLALGTAGRTLVSVVLVESAVLGVVAVLCGLALGLAGHAAIAHYGVDLLALAGTTEVAGIVLDGRIYSRLGALEVLRWSGLVIGLVVLAAIYPAVRAARLQPVEAMRHA